MNYRLKTSEYAGEVFTKIKNRFGVTPNIASRLSIALSLKEEYNAENIIDKVKKIDSRGLEFQRHTLVGDNEATYKAMMEVYYGKHLSDEDFFPSHYKYHLERGLNKLNAEAEIANNLDAFVKNFINL